jgi:hypothetical protein
MEFLTRFAPGILLPRRRFEVQAKGQDNDMAFDVHHKRGVMDAIDEREESALDVNLWAIAAGAAAGAFVAYALGTARGRRALDDVIVMLDDFTSGCAQFSQACARAHLAASDGWRLVTGGRASR